MSHPHQERQGAVTRRRHRADQLDVIRSARLAVLALLAALLLAGCSSSSLTAEAVVGELSALYPAPDARDNTGSCADAGCVQLVTTDAVSVYQWPDEGAAARHAAEALVEADQVGPFVLSYGGDQALTSAEARAAYAGRVRELLGG